ARRVTGVGLIFVAFSWGETGYFACCFDLVCHGSVEKGSKLNLEEQAAECWCASCQQYVTLLTPRVRRCPLYHGDMLQIVADDGLQIRRIEIDQ
ncbi:hydrogenase/urease nickel incorporation protein HypA, partial [Escherichia coli]|uniref:hydrogenase/urease nickel incorporation protein HypA n=1 Tax=Escherichia coli TaxID=562 RepID=UPI001C707D73